MSTPTRREGRNSASNCAVSTEVSKPVQVLVVCTANTCRSPAAARYLRHHAERNGVELDVSSAGFGSAGQLASDAMSEVMGERGFDLSPHRSQTLTCELVGAADLVVTMERRHVHDLAEMCGPRRIFTLPDAIAALAGVAPEVRSPRSRIAAAEDARERGDLPRGAHAEIEDPFGQSIDMNRRTAELLNQLTDELVQVLAPVASITAEP